MVRPSSDPAQEAARHRYLATRQEEVFYSRQVEVAHEDDHSHWITNRVIHELVEDGVLLEETRPLATGGDIHLLWPRSYKHYRRRAKAVVGLVEEYASPNIGAAVGLQGEALVLEGFARHPFVLRGRNTNEYRGQKWSAGEHDVDFIFERDGRGYGVEVKNTLGYMDQDEFRTKIAVCRKLGLFPVFAARMLPRTWIHELEAMAGGFARACHSERRVRIHFPWRPCDSSICRRRRHPSRASQPRGSSRMGPNKIESRKYFNGPRLSTFASVALASLC